MSNSGTLQTVSNAIVWNGSSYTSPQCDVDGYVDINVGSFALTPNVPTHLELMVYANPAAIFNATGFYNDLFVFAINNAQLTTVATDTTSGQVLLPSQITAPGFSNYDVYVDVTELWIMEPVSAGAPWPITATQGQNDVLLGVLNATNRSNTLSATVNELAISDELIGLANAVEPDITNIRLYEWDYALNQPIGAPLASGLNMGASNVVYAQSLNLNFPPIGIPGAIKFLAVVGDITPTFMTDTGYDVSYDSGTATDDNEIEIGLHVTGLSNPITASDPSIPFNIKFNQSSTSINPFVCPSWNTCDIALGNLVDVQPATSIPTCSLDLNRALPVQNNVLLGVGMSSVVLIDFYAHNNCPYDIEITDLQVSQGPNINLSPTLLTGFYLDRAPYTGIPEITPQGLNTSGIATWTGESVVIPANTSEGFILRGGFDVVYPQVAGFDVPHDTGSYIDDNELEVYLTGVLAQSVATGNSIPVTYDDCYNLGCTTFDALRSNIFDMVYSGSVMTRHELLANLFAIQGEPLIPGISGCSDTSSAQEDVWNTAISLGLIFLPSSGGACSPLNIIIKAEASKILAMYASTVTGTMTIISPSVQSFPDVLLFTWYFDWVESMYSAMGNVFAVGGNHFYPALPLSTNLGITWISNLP